MPPNEPLVSLPLFDEPPSFDRRKLASKLQDLASHGIFLGGSSWKYEGWMGQIYTPQRYYTRGRFSRKKFEEQCLSEYAETFPIVCGDFSFYQFPSPEFWSRMFTSAGNLKFGLKVPEEVTIKSFPTHPRYGPKAGLDNPTFLDADFFDLGFAQLLLPYKDQISVLIFEFGTFPKKAYGDPQEFFRDLDAFLAKLRPDFRYGVEVRNPEFLVPEYFAVLRNRNVAHVFNAWTRMPAISRQMALPDSFTADFVVARALLREGRPYEAAVEKFSPYATVQDENPEVRASLKELIERARRRRENAYLFVNNRLEGNSPMTIMSIVDVESD
jgi:uncharacterized protein YecE (DUF72 family)